MNNDVVWTDPARMGGTPCFRGTRVPVEMILGYIKAGETGEGIKQMYPYLSEDQINWAVREAHS